MIIILLLIINDLSNLIRSYNNIILYFKNILNINGLISIINNINNKYTMY